MILARVALVFAALVTALWFAVGVRADHEENSVQVVINRNHLTNAEERAVMSRLSKARLLNPDEQVNVLAAQAAFLASHPREAISIAQGIVTREPENPNAWLVLDVVAARTSPRLLSLSRLRLSQLVPPVKPAP